MSGKSVRGKTSITNLKASRQKQRKKWLATIPDGKLPNNQMIEV